MNTRFELITRTVGKSFNHYSGECVRLSSQLPYSFDEVVVRNVNNTSDVRKITTFRDSLGKITERIFDYNSRPIRNQLYEYAENNIGKNERVTTSILHEYETDRDTLNVYKYYNRIGKLKTRLAHLPLKKIVSTHISLNKKNNERVVSRTSVEQKSQFGNRIHRFEEFPHIISSRTYKNFPKKSLTFEVSPNKYRIIEKSIECEYTSFPSNDSFLSVRALPIEDAKVPLTRILLRRRHPHLEKTNVKIIPDFNPTDRPKKEQGFIAEFDYLTGELRFNRKHRFVSKSKLAENAGHESEHVWQRYLCSRLCNSSIPWERNIYITFGEIDDKALLSEAKDYNKSFFYYVPFSEDFEMYKKNYVEIKANEAEIIIKQQYEDQGKEIRENFPHIPAELL